ncbi:hypothetical protein MMC08_001352 [Hypocenomyce scalaris]|nr:hypothetical protein [Hypocenomyce scalaris]
MKSPKKGTKLDFTRKGGLQAVLGAETSNKNLSLPAMEFARKEGGKVQHHSTMTSHNTVVSGHENSKPGLHSSPVNSASSVDTSPSAGRTRAHRARASHGSTRTSTRTSTASVLTASVPTVSVLATPTVPVPELSATPVATATVVEQFATPADLVHSAPAVASTATQLKRNYAVAMGQNPSSTVRLVAQHDPENHEIKRLRQRDKLKWGEIAEILNKQRITAGKTPSLTDNAVYSRYVRNGPRIAANEGESWDPSCVGQPLSKRVQSMAPIVGFDAVQDEMLVKAYQDIQQETWELVSERIVAMGGKRHDPEICARRYQAI